MGAYLIPDDFNTHIYAEAREEIARENNDDEVSNLMNTAITAAIAEAKGYMSRWDLPALFGSGTGDDYVAPTITDENLKAKVKDLALWHFIKVGNANIEMGRIQAAYEYAIDWFKQLMKGYIMPEGWAYKDTTGQTAPEGSGVKYTEVEKRGSRF